MLDAKTRAEVAEKKLELISDDLDFIVLSSIEREIAKEMEAAGYSSEQIESVCSDLYDSLDLYMSMRDGTFTIACSLSSRKMTVCKKIDVRRIFTFSAGIVKALYDIGGKYGGIQADD